MGHAASVAEGSEHPALLDADLVIVDPAATGSGQFIAAVDAHVMVCSSDCAEDSVLAALQAGAVGYLRKDTLTSETLGAAVKAAANGTGVMTPDLLGTLLRGLSSEKLEPGRPAAARLDRPRAAGARADRRGPSHARGRTATLLFRAYSKERAARRRHQAQRP